METAGRISTAGRCGSSMTSPRGRRWMRKPRMDRIHGCRSISGHLHLVWGMGARFVLGGQ